MKKMIWLCALLLAIALILSACTPNLSSPSGREQQSNPAPVSQTDTTPAVNTDPELTVYFLDVEQAEAAVVVCCHGNAMLIDGGNPGDSDFIYTFLRNHNITHLDYIVATHGHEDHVGGLSGALNFATAGIALSPVTEYDTRAFNSFVRYLDEQGVSITVPAHGDTFTLGGADVLVVAPITETSNVNNTSIVLKVTHGDVSFLFTGDAERASEQRILEAGYNISATVLQVGHHGSETSTSYPFLREIMPQYAVISCGTNNSYGHPDEDVLSRLRDADVMLYRTDMQGTITFVSNGKTVTVTTERNANAITNPTITESDTTPPEDNTQTPLPQDGVDEYIGNINTKRLHLPTCSGLPQESNRIFFATRETAIETGYEPCGICKP